MSDEDRLDSLIDRWEALRAKGHDISAEEICADCPEMIGEFKERIAKLQRFETTWGNSPEVAEITELGGGRYVIEGLHEQGGLGALYIAQDKELCRRVIVKVPRADRAGHAIVERQFVAEAMITGQLEHPGIVPVYSFGRDESRRRYYAMKMIHGVTLRNVIRQYHETAANRGDTVAFQRLLRDFLSVCQTIHFAHSRGVIHRDIKPANIMLGKFGEVLIVDWGLAKQVAGGYERFDTQWELDPIVVSDYLQTRHGSVKGSPMYMSPEQAAGEIDEIGPASDIYGLGATLYELLTGQTPFDGNSIEEIVAQVKSGSIRPPREVRADVPAALEAICLKAMKRDPKMRYTTAKALANDLENYLADEPVSVYREPASDQIRRWARKHRTLTTSAAATTLMALVALGSIAGLLTKFNQDMGSKNLELEEAARVANASAESERRKSAELERSLYANQLMVAASAWSDANLLRTRAVLESTQPELRSLEWNYARRLCKEPPALAKYAMARPREMYSIVGLSVSPDGAWLATDEIGPVPGREGAQRSTHVISPEDGIAKLGAGGGFLAFSPRGDKLLRAAPPVAPGSGREYRLSLVNLTQGARAQLPEDVRWQSEPLRDQGYNLFAAAFVMPEGVEDDPLIVVLDDPWTNGPDGKQYRAARFTFYDARMGRSVKKVEGANVQNATEATFSPDGRMVALRTSAPGAHGVAVLSSIDGKKLYTLDGHEGPIGGVSFSGDSKRIATAGADRAVRTWDATTGNQKTVLWGLRERPSAVALDDAGQRVAAASADRSIRAWDASSGELLRVFPMSESRTSALAFARKSSLLFAGGSDGVVYKLDLQPASGEPIRERDIVSKLRLSPRGDLLAVVVSGAASLVRVSSRQDGQLRYEVSLYDPRSKSSALYAEDIAFSPDGKWLAISGDNFVQVVSADTGERKWRVEGLEAPLAFTADGKRLVVLRRRQKLLDVFRSNKTIERIDAKSRELVSEWIRGIVEPAEAERGPVDLDEALILRLKSQETLLAELKEQAKSALVVVSAETGAIERVLDIERAKSVAGRPAKPWIAVAGNTDGTIEIWDLETGKRLHVIETPQSLISQISYHPSGDRLIVAGMVAAPSSGAVLDDNALGGLEAAGILSGGPLGNSVLIVDAKSGKVEASLTGRVGNTYPVKEAAYTPDGRRVVTCAVDGTVRIFDAESAVELWRIDASSPLFSLSMSADGHWLAAAGGDPRTSAGEVFLWDVSPPEGAAAPARKNLTQVVDSVIEDRQ